MRWRSSRFSSGLMIVFAAEVDKCTEKFDACKITCTNRGRSAMAQGQHGRRL